MLIHHCQNSPILMAYLKKLSVDQTKVLRSRMVNAQWIRKDMEGNDSIQFEVLSCRGTEGARKALVKILGIPAGVGTWILPNRSLEPYNLRQLTGSKSN
jgi:hypothetical protein